MYVCSCFAVTDRQIEQAFESGARTVDDVTRVCRAGGDCGSCLGQIADLIADRAEDTLIDPCSLTRKPCAA